MFDRPPKAEDLQLDEARWQRLSSSVYENKALGKAKALARSLKEIDADIVMLCEVGGLESLTHFNELFLGQAYSPALLEGNSDRHIDVGFLVRKELPFYFDLSSNKNRPINYLYPHEREDLANDTGAPPSKNPSLRFSRDVAELKLFQKDREDPFLVMLLTHLKSRLDPDRVDPGGFERRRAELETLVQIHLEMKAKHPKALHLVSGDLNGNASRHQTDQEFQALYRETDLQDVLEWAALPLEARATYYQVRNGGRAEGRQIDYALLGPEASALLQKDSCFVYRYKDERGLEYDVPRSLDAKLNLPSDHYPLVFRLENLQCW